MGFQAAAVILTQCDRGIWWKAGRRVSEIKTMQKRKAPNAQPWWLEQAPRQCLCPSSAASRPITFPHFKPPSCIGSGQAQNASAPSSERRRGEADKAPQVCCQILYFNYIPGHFGTLGVLETRRYQGNSSMAVLTNSIALLVFISVVLAASDLDAPQSISSLDDYGRQRVCARGCFWGGRGGDPASYDSIGGSLSCDTPGNSGSPNWCFCRADQQSVAVSYLSNCVNSKCGKNAVDTNLATSLYLAYCTPKVAPKPDAISTTTTPTAAATGPAQTVPVTSGPGAVQTVYVTSGSRSRLTINFSLALVLVKPILASMVVCFR